MSKTEKTATQEIAPTIIDETTTRKQPRQTEDQKDNNYNFDSQMSRQDTKNNKKKQHKIRKTIWRKQHNKKKEINQEQQPQQQQIKHKCFTGREWGSFPLGSKKEGAGEESKGPKGRRQ